MPIPSSISPRLVAQRWGAPWRKGCSKSRLRPAFLAHVSELADLFDAGFRELKARHGDVLVGLRQKGLMMGIELAHEAYGPLFTKAAFDHGLLSIYAGNYPRVAQLLPPLIIERALVGEILERVDGALGQVRLMAQR